MWAVPILALAVIIALAATAKAERKVTTVHKTEITRIIERERRPPKPLTPSEKKKLEDTVSALVRAPDKLATDVPIIDGKPAYYQAVMRTGQRLPITAVGIGNMIVPNNRVWLAIFKTLQATIGAREDGRIGPDTLNRFIVKVTQKGFTRHPLTVASLARNAVKWTEVLQKGYRPNQVG